MNTPTMHVHRLTSDELAPLAGEWNQLTRGVPFRRFEWLAAWWRHYGAGRELFTLAVRDEANRLVGAAPWFRERSPVHGRVVRFLGSGEVCSDHLSLLVRPEHEAAVAASLADWLARAASGEASGGDRWDVLDLHGIDGADSAMALFAGRLEARGCLVDRRPGPNCWRIPLAGTWEEYVATLSKSHRKQVRRVERRELETGVAVLRVAASAADVAAAFETLVDLHQRRRRSLGEPGCFADRRFAPFLREAADSLVPAGAMRLYLLEKGGRPVAAEIHLVGDGVDYAYQAGIEPEAAGDEPGRIMNVALLQGAIDRGQAGFDFLRGDEPYKAHWRAEPRAGIELRAVSRHALARLRHGAWVAGKRIKGWIKRSLAWFGIRTPAVGHAHRSMAARALLRPAQPIRQADPREAGIRSVAAGGAGALDAEQSITSSPTEPPSAED